MNPFVDFFRMLFDVFFPRFITERVAMLCVDGEWTPFLPMSCIEEGDEYHGIGTIRSFNLFGWAINCKLIELEITDSRYKGT